MPPEAAAGAMLCRPMLKGGMAEIFCPAFSILSVIKCLSLVNVKDSLARATVPLQMIAFLNISAEGKLRDAAVAGFQ